MLAIDKTKTVMATGATGYVAGWIVIQLLEEGVTGHVIVRDPVGSGKLSHLKELAAKLPGTIRHFSTDLLEQGSYAERK